MRSIYKHTIAKDGIENISIPKGAVLLSCKKQGNQIAIWFDVDVNEYLREVRQFECIMTGHEPPYGAKFIDTCLFENDSFVLHVFEILS